MLKVVIESPRRAGRKAGWGVGLQGAQPAPVLSKSLKIPQRETSPDWWRTVKTEADISDNVCCVKTQSSAAGCEDEAVDVDGFWPGALWRHLNARRAKLQSASRPEDLCFFWLYILVMSAHVERYRICFLLSERTDLNQRPRCPDTPRDVWFWVCCGALVRSVNASLSAFKSRTLEVTGQQTNVS